MSDKNNFYDINQYADAMISKIVQFTKEEIKRTAIRIESAIVTNVHDDGSADVVLPSDKNSGFTKIQNQSTHPLKAGDAVEILLKNGSFNNCWIIAKHGAGVSSYNKDGSSTTFVNMGGGNGLIEEYTLPVASATVLGGVKIGSGLNMNNGVLSVSEIAIPVTSVNGKTGVIELTSTDIGLGNVANERQYSANNPPPYPVTSVNGQTGEVTIDIPEIPDIPKAATTPPKDISSTTSIGTSDKYAREDHIHKGVVSVDGADGQVTTYAVKYNVSQSLTDAEKEQARNNIGAVDSNYVVDNGGKIDKIQVNGTDQTITNKTVNLQLTASDVGAIATSAITTTLGVSKTKVPSEYAVLQAMDTAGYGDMLKSIFATNSKAVSGWVDKSVQAEQDTNGDIIANTYTRTIVSTTEPTSQYEGDFWYQITT